VNAVVVGDKDTHTLPLPPPHSPSKTGVNALSLGEVGVP
jgi:hypothetical protein